MNNQISNLKNMHEGERCCIIGNGPSLNKIDITKLNGQPSFSVNSIYYKIKSDNFIPYYYSVEDRFVFIENICEIRAIPAKTKFFPKTYASLYPNTNNVCFINLDLDFYNPKSPYHYIPRFSLNCADIIYAGQTVTFMNMQLALYMGFKEIILVGMDFDYKVPPGASNIIVSKEDDMNHFHPDYFGRGKRWHDPNLENVYKSYQLFKLYSEFKGVKVINATNGGKLELFQREKFSSIYL
jgi:hypothetical protein